MLASMAFFSSGLAALAAIAEKSRIPGRRAMYFHFDGG